MVTPAELIAEARDLAATAARPVQLDGGPDLGTLALGYLPAMADALEACEARCARLAARLDATERRWSAVSEAREEHLVEARERVARLEAAARAFVGVMPQCALCDAPATGFGGYESQNVCDAHQPTDYRTFPDADALRALLAALGEPRP